MSEAEEILEEAVAWWDVERSGFRDGDRWLRNLGTGGSALDLRLGSSLLVNTNDPKWLGPEQIGYVYLPSNAGNFLSIPHVGGTQVGDIMDCRVDLFADNWNPLTALSFMGKATGTAAANLSFSFGSNTGTQLQFQFSDGTTTTTAGRGVLNAAPFTTAGRLRLRVTYERNTGSGQYAVKFFYNDSDFISPLDTLSSWTQLSTTVTGASIGSMNDSTGDVLTGARRSFIDAAFAGRYYGSSLSISGSTVFLIDCDSSTSSSATSFTATTGQTVGINRSTGGRMAVSMPAIRNGGRPCFLLGTDDYLECVDAQQHGALNFYGDSFTAAISFRIWTTLTSGILTKRDTPSLGVYADFPGWGIVGSTQNVRVLSQVSDGINGNATALASTETSITSGKQHFHAFTVNRATSTMNLSRDGNAGSSAAIKGIGGLQSRAPFRIARSGAGYANMEFRSAAIWRRPLTTREINILANSNLWGT